MSDPLHEEIEDSVKLFFIGTFLLILGLFFEIVVADILGFIPRAFIYLSLYVYYRYALEHTSKPPDKFPDLRAIIICLFLSITVIIVASLVTGAWTQVNLWYGVGSDPEALVDAIIKLIDYLIRMGQEYKWGY